MAVLYGYGLVYLGVAGVSLAAWACREIRFRLALWNFKREAVRASRSTQDVMF